MTPSFKRREALLTHLESLYAFGQVLMPDATAAAELTQQAYQRAYALEAERGPSDDDKALLLQLMWMLYEEQTQPAANVTLETSTLAAFERRLSEQLVDRALPMAYASLQPLEQIALLLCDLEGLSPYAAAIVLKKEEAEVTALRTEAQAKLWYQLRREVSPSGRRMLEKNLAEDWISHALQRTLHAGLAPAPTSLFDDIALMKQERSTSSADRPAQKNKARPRRRWGRMVAGLVLLSVLTGGGFWYFQRPPASADPNLLTLSLNRAPDLSLIVRTPSVEQAERFVQDRLNVRVTLPDILDARLKGVAITPLLPGVEAPVFIYEDTDQGKELTLYTYTYRLLDKYPEQLQLAPDILRQIEQEHQFDLHDLGRNQVLLWRDQDDIFIAITAGNAATLRDRIAFPS